jgi:hypothetical protein
LYKSTLLSSDMMDLCPMIQYKSFTFKSICILFFLAICCFHVSLESKWNPRYVMWLNIRVVISTARVLINTLIHRQEMEGHPEREAWGTNVAMQFFLGGGGVEWDWFHVVRCLAYCTNSGWRMELLARGNRSSRRILAPLPLCPPQIPHDLTWARTRTAGD